MQQMRAKVPFYTPEWNPGQEGEAGLALARIYVQMLEQVLFRLNQAPDKNFVAFLDMLGIDMQPAQSARAIVTFKLVEGTLEHVLVPAGTQLAAEGAIDGQEVIFETQNDLRVTPAVLTEIFGFDAPNDKIFHHPSQLEISTPFELFTGSNLQERSLYIGHNDLLTLTKPTDITVQFSLSRGATAGTLSIAWEYWNGERWVLLRSLSPPVPNQSGELIANEGDSTELFAHSGAMTLRKTTGDEIKVFVHHDQESRWLRCRLQNQLTSRMPVQFPVIDTLALSVSPIEPFAPELAFNNDVPLNLEKINLEMKSTNSHRTTLFSFNRVPPYTPPGKGEREIYVLANVNELKAGDVLKISHMSGTAEEEFQVIEEATSLESTGTLKLTLTAALAFNHAFPDATIELALGLFDPTHPRPSKGDQMIYLLGNNQEFHNNDYIRLADSLSNFEIQTIGSTTQVSDTTVEIKLKARLQFDYDSSQAKVELVTALRANDTTVSVESFAGIEILEGSKATLRHGNQIEEVEVKPDTPSNTSLTLTGNQQTYLTGDIVSITPIIKPFGELPALFDTFYFASDEAFSKNGATITITVDTELNDKPAAFPTEIDPVLSWEYWNGRGWRGLRVTDETNRFLKDGDIRFRCPEDIQKVEVNGEEKYWIRVRIVDGDYGREIIVKPKNDGTPEVKIESSKIHFPIIFDLSINYETQHLPPEKCFTLNNLDFVDRLADVLDPDHSFAPYEIIREDFASLYLGFNNKLEGGPISILFDLDEQFLSEEDRVKMAWFYWNGSDWIQLNVEDRTEQLTRKDLLKFSMPNDFARLELFDKTLFWIKGSVIESEHNDPVKILGIFPNSTDAIQASIANEEVLGSSNGTSSQEFRLLNPLIITQEVRVTEPNRPSEDEEQAIIQEEGKEKAAIVELKDATGEVTGYAVRWHAVKDFDGSGPQSRHYTVDKRLGVVKFGDGNKGLVPPFGTDNIVADYKFGGGKNGNVGVGKISSLKNAIPFVSEVTNHLPADGGSETETLEEVLVRGPLELKNRNRAVSAEDFESLARNASRKIVRAKCLPNTDESGEHAPGRVTVLVVPDSQQAGEEPTRLLIKIVEDYLLEHSANLVSAANRIHVAGAKYVEIVVEPTLVPVNLDAAARVESEALTRLKRFIHPITGGPDQSGWEFGKKICRAEIIALLEGIPDLDHVKDLKISANGVKQAGDVVVDSFSLPFSGEHRININLDGRQAGGKSGTPASECAAERFFKECPV